MLVIAGERNLRNAKQQTHAKQLTEKVKASLVVGTGLQLSPAICTALQQQL